MGNPEDRFSCVAAHIYLFSAFVKKYFRLFFVYFVGDDLESLLFHFMDEWLFMFSAEPFFIARVSKTEKHESPYGKTNNLHRRKQRRRSASR